MKKRVMILFAPGTNCQIETQEAFRLAGADARIVFLNDILENRVRITDCDVFFTAGGFSFGDHINTGTIVSILLRDYFPRLIEAGIPVGGECNGFQILMRAGFFGKGITLTENDTGVFCSRPVLHWVHSTNCVWTAGLERTVLAFPSAHHGGKIVGDTTGVVKVMSYHAGTSPNGGSIAAISTANGLVFGVMDHLTRPYDNPHGQLICKKVLKAA